MKFVPDPITGEDDNYYSVRYLVYRDGVLLGKVWRYHSKDWGWSTKSIHEITAATRRYAAARLAASHVPGN